MIYEKWCEKRSEEAEWGIYFSGGRWLDVLVNHRDHSGTMLLLQIQESFFKEVGGTNGLERDVMEEWKLNDIFLITGATRTWRSWISLYLLAARTINQMISHLLARIFLIKVHLSPRYRIIQERKASANMRYYLMVLYPRHHSLITQKKRKTWMLWMSGSCMIKVVMLALHR